MNFLFLCTLLLSIISVTATSRPYYKRAAKPELRRRAASYKPRLIKRQNGGNSTTTSSNSTVISPKVFIINMFSYEQAVFLESDLKLYSQNITVPGFSPLYPEAHCNEDASVCEMTTGEAEINAASSITALVRSDLFNLTQTYFLIAGIAGVNPYVGTICSVFFNKYVVQFALEYEFDIRDIGSNYSTGYIPFGSVYPQQYPSTIYGTEVFELNENLRDKAWSLAVNQTLNDTSDAIQYRATYNQSILATSGPAVVKADGVNSDVYYSGAILSGAAANYTKLMTNGSGVYATTAQEDNATLEAMVRAAADGLMDFARIVVMRTASDFDQPAMDTTAPYNLFYANQGSFEPALKNLYIAGNPFIQDVLMYWNTTYQNGFAAGNYIGDILNTLGAGSPDFGNPADFV